MIRYHLDDLGAYQFEKLSQSLLKAAVGLGVESWGNRSDLGRDAYSESSLNFPDPKVASRGPFLFQTKFVEGANGAGARPTKALLANVTAELKEVKKRQAKGTWKQPSHFTFITNAPITATLREKLRKTCASALLGSEIHLWSGDDACDLLDDNPRICRAFPQLLSIRDLDELIRKALTSKSRERSKAAIQIAKELVPVFAPTSSLDRSWAVLHKHSFAVLEGPPEVGKSAIAWMTALTQAGLGWEAIVCRTPDDFFEAYSRDKSQIFIADDAFGRTEYDPTRTSRWEADLDLILHKLDRKHWLVWTSREHILRRACDRMDAQGKARSFPDPAAVLVDVKELSVEERALILYRHARAANLERPAKALIRANAREIIFDPEFTPERIRRFVRESLPGLIAAMSASKLKSSQVRDAITEALRNPTKQMQIAFRKLPPAYKWFLVALLESSDEFQFVGNLDHLRKIYEMYCPDAHHEPFTNVVEHLTEAFVKRRVAYKGEVIDWIHPSYRDLVIDSLVEDAELRNTFLKRASLKGIKLAVSDVGGKYGERRLPFIRNAESWDTLSQRCLTIPSNRFSERELLQVLADAASESDSPDQRKRWTRLISPVVTKIKARWETRNEHLDARDVEAFGKARSFSEPAVPLPNLEKTWEAAEENFRQSLEQATKYLEFDYVPFDELSELALAIENYAPEFLQSKDFPARYEQQIVDVMAIADRELIQSRDYDASPDKLHERATRLEEFGAAIERFVPFAAKLEIDCTSLPEQLDQESEHLEEEASRREPQDPDYDSDRSASSGSEPFDIGKLFSEL